MTDEPRPPGCERRKYFKLKERAGAIINKLEEYGTKGKVYIRVKWLIRAEHIPVSVARSD